MTIESRPRLHTPANERPAGRKIKLIIDGREVETTQGKTVLHAAIEAGIYIPTSATTTT